MLEKWIVNNLTAIANAIVGANSSKEIKVASIETLAQDTDVSELLDTGQITISRYIDDVLADTFSSSSAYGLVYARKKDIDDLQDQIDSLTEVDTSVFLKADGSVTMTDDINMGGNAFTNGHSINIIYVNPIGNAPMSIYASTTYFGVSNVDTGGEVYLHDNARIRYTSIPTYANNAAAVTGGLAIGTFYKTTAGELRIVV